MPYLRQESKKIEYAPGVQRWNGIGGMVDKGEDPKAAVVREIAEETNLVVRQEDLEQAGEIELDQLALIVFTAKRWNGDLTVKDPTLKELQWFTFNKVPYSEMWEGNDRWLPKALVGELI